MFFFEQKTAYEMRISDWSSDVCSSDLLVLAVDTSSSVSPQEFDLQMRGFAGAFREPAVIAAIVATGRSGIAVSMIQWSDNRRQQVAVDWQLLTNEDDVADFATAIDDTPRFLDGGGTAIGGAIEFGVAELGRNGFEGRRRVIDISGDGRANQGASPDGLRDMAVLQGITINGLAILNEDSRSEEHTSELQSLMRISYAVFCLKKK